MILEIEKFNIVAEFDFLARSFVGQISASNWFLSCLSIKLGKYDPQNEQYSALKL